MNGRPLVTIVTPTLNQVEFLESTLRSVVTQSYCSLEYIIIDGGSTDGSLEIIKSYAERYPCITWLSEKDAGQSDAITKGFGMANGTLLAWINSDDLYEPDAVYRIVDHFIKNPDIGMVYGDAWIIDNQGDRLKKYEFTRDFDVWSLVHIWDYIVQPAVFFRRATLENVGGVDPALNWCMDWDLWIRMARVTKTAYLPLCLACSREYRNTKTSTGGAQRLAEIRRLMMKYSENRYFPPRGYWIYYFDTISRSLEDGFISRVFKMMTVHPLIRFLVGKP